MPIVLYKNSRIRVTLDKDRREIMIPRHPGRYPPDFTPPTYLDAIQLRVCDLEFIDNIECITPVGQPGQENRDLITQDWDSWMIPVILRKVFTIN